MTAADAPEIRWPNVPACHGWLSLDRRGNWRLKGERISHPGLIAYINDRYGPDESGNWIFRNGPQMVYVMLDYTPLVLRLGPCSRPVAHTGADVGEVLGAFLDDEGSVLLQTATGVGLVDDRDLAAFFDACLDSSANAVSESALQDVIAGGMGVFWQGLALRPIRQSDVAARFGFRPDS